MAFLNIPAEYANKTVEEVVSQAGSGQLLIPEGDYKAVIVETSPDLESTKDGNGKFLKLKLVITEGQQRDTEFIERLNLENANPTAVKIAYESLAKISAAVGISGSYPKNSEELHNKYLLIVVKTVKGKPYVKDGQEYQGHDKSEIKGYKPLPKVGVGVSVPQTSGVAPAKAAMPWEKK